MMLINQNHTLQYNTTFNSDFNNKYNKHNLRIQVFFTKLSTK